MTRPQNENMIWCQEDNKTAQKDKNTSRQQNDTKFKLASVEKKQNKRLKEVLVFSSGQCLDASLWCDGVEHCAEDELDCPPPTPTISLPSKTTPFPERLILNGIRASANVSGFHLRELSARNQWTSVARGWSQWRPRLKHLTGVHTIRLYIICYKVGCCPYYKVEHLLL